MKRLFLVLIVFLMLSSFAYAQGYEAITVAGTALGLTTTTVGRATWGMCRLETAEIRYTIDGVTTPTNTVGVVMEPLEWVVLNNQFELKNFRAIRTGGTSGSLKCHYFER
jgi:hypothetical protein